jgi:hypothetical protein
MARYRMEGCKCVADWFDRNIPRKIFIENTSDKDSTKLAARRVAEAEELQGAGPQRAAFNAIVERIMEESQREEAESSVEQSIAQNRRREATSTVQGVEKKQRAKPGETEGFNVRRAFRPREDLACESSPVHNIDKQIATHFSFNHLVGNLSPEISGFTKLDHLRLGPDNTTELPAETAHLSKLVTHQMTGVWLNYNHPHSKAALTQSTGFGGIDVAALRSSSPCRRSPSPCRRSPSPCAWTCET